MGENRPIKGGKAFQEKIQFGFLQRVISQTFGLYSCRSTTEKVHFVKNPTVLVNFPVKSRVRGKVELFEQRAVIV